jgi:hypothetical protein
MSNGYGYMRMGVELVMDIVGQKVHQNGGFNKTRTWVRGKQPIPGGHYNPNGLTGPETRFDSDSVKPVLVIKVVERDENFVKSD